MRSAHEIATWLLTGAVLLSGCGKEEVREPVSATPATGIRLTISPEWNGAPFDQNTRYVNISDHTVIVQFVKFYLAEMELIGAGSSSNVFDIDLFDITNGPLTKQYNVDPGSYDSLRFGLGVPYDLNHSDPAQYPNSHPLSVNNGTFWPWALDRYRFLMFDGRFDTITSSLTDPLPFGFSLHTGRDTCYRTLSLDGAINVVEGQITQVNLDVDISKFFYSSADTFDLSEGSQAHGAEVDRALLLTQNAVSSFSLQ